MNSENKHVRNHIKEEFYYGKRLGAQGIPCPAALVHSVQPGQELLLDDGKLLARVDTAEPDALVCTVMRGGVLQSRKSLAAPGADIHIGLARGWCRRAACACR